MSSFILVHYTSMTVNIRTQSDDEENVTVPITPTRNGCVFHNMSCCLFINHAMLTEGL